MRRRKRPMPMNNGNMPNTDGRGNGTRRTVRPDGSPLGNGAYQSGGARGNTAHTDGADRRRTAHKPTDARLRENGARRKTGKTERTGTARSRAGNDVGQNGARRRPENSRVGGANRRTDNAAPAQYYRRRARPRVRRHSVPRAGEKRFLRKSARSSARGK